MELYERAQIEFDKLGMQSETADNLQNMGNVRNSQGRYDEAMVLYERAQIEFKRLGMDLETPLVRSLK